MIIRFGIEDTLKYLIMNHRSYLNVERYAEPPKDFFERRAHMDFYDYAQEERKDMLTIEVARIYKVRAENEDISKSMQDKHEENLQIVVC